MTTIKTVWARAAKTAGPGGRRRRRREEEGEEEEEEEEEGGRLKTGIFPRN